MSDLNPYEKYLDGRPIEVILAATPATLLSLLEAIGTEKSGKAPGPGKWSAAEILCHLADCEMAFGFRLRQTLAEDNHVIQPFDQERWAASYPGVSSASALAAFTAMRNWNLELIEKTLPTSAERTVTHPERGTMTFKNIVETMAGHDLNHVGQLKRIAEGPASR